MIEHNTPDNEDANADESAMQPARKGGTFQKGVSGNPEGRKKGTQNRSTLIKAAIEGKMVDRLEKDAVAVLEKTIELALQGDTTCIKLLMDRLLPARKAIDEMAPQKNGGGISIVIQSMPSTSKEKTIINGTRVTE